MGYDIPPEARTGLRSAFDDRRLTLYLGAGVSVASGLPTWQRLVIMMYFEMLRQSDRWAYANYLHAVAEWMLAKSPEPLEITAQKIRAHYGTDSERFMSSMKRQLYSGFEEDGGYHVPRRAALRRGNPTLAAVARICELPGRGVDAVITYNYDDLLEIALLARRRHQTIDSEAAVVGTAMPIFHVHGYVPIRNGEEPTSPDDIVFTEERYHEATTNAYSWSNLVQLRGLSASTGLMVGLSLSDRNIRRLLYALSNSPVGATCFAVLQRPTWKQPEDNEARQVSAKALELFERAQRSGSETPRGYGVKGDNWEAEVNQILERAHDVAASRHDQVLRGYGITPIWYDHHAEIPDILADVFS